MLSIVESQKSAIKYHGTAFLHLLATAVVRKSATAIKHHGTPILHLFNGAVTDYISSRKLIFTIYKAVTQVYIYKRI